VLFHGPSHELTALHQTPLLDLGERRQRKEGDGRRNGEGKENIGMGRGSLTSILPTFEPS